MTVSAISKTKKKWGTEGTDTSYVSNLSKIIKNGVCGIKFEKTGKKYVYVPQMSMDFENLGLDASLMVTGNVLNGW